ncbi:unnamed protein product, partial [Ilex paraguariensis]
MEESVSTEEVVGSCSKSRLSGRADWDGRSRSFIFLRGLHSLAIGGIISFLNSEIFRFSKELNSAMYCFVVDERSSWSLASVCERLRGRGFEDREKESFMVLTMENQTNERAMIGLGKMYAG